MLLIPGLEGDGVVVESEGIDNQFALDGADSSVNTSESMTQASKVEDPSPPEPGGSSSSGNGVSEGTGDVAKQGLNFTKTTAKWMDNPGRAVPVQTFKQAIEHGVEGPDPQGTNAVMYYTRMYRNGSEYNLEVLYDKATNTILHFEYARKAM